MGSVTETRSPVEQASLGGEQYAYVQVRLSGSITFVTNPSAFDAITSARPEAEVTVSHEFASAGQWPVPGDGLSYVTERLAPPAVVSPVNCPVLLNVYATYGCVTNVYVLEPESYVRVAVVYGSVQNVPDVPGPTSGDGQEPSVGGVNDTAAPSPWVTVTKPVSESTVSDVAQLSVHP